MCFASENMIASCNWTLPTCKVFVSEIMLKTKFGCLQIKGTCRLFEDLNLKMSNLTLVDKKLAAVVLNLGFNDICTLLCECMRNYMGREIFVGEY